MSEAHKLDVVVSAVDKASAPLKRIGGGFSMLSKQGLAAGAMFAGVTMGIGLVVNAIQGLGQFIGDSVQSFREFERSMSEVATMLDEVGDKQIPEMTDNIVAMSIEFGKSADDLARGLYQILSAGIDSSKSMVVLHESAKLAAATLTDVETSVDAVTTVLNAYGMHAGQVGEITELFAKTIQLGKLRMDDLANALGYVVPIASQAGISIDEVAAAIATLTKQGINAHKASRGLRQVINQLVAPSEEAAGAMVDMGIAYDDLTVEAVGLEGVMQMINVATGGQIGEMTRLIPNVQALSAGLGLMADNGQIFASSAEYVENKFGALDEMFQDVASDSMFLADQTKAVNDELNRQVGEALAPATQAWEDYWTVFRLNALHFMDFTYNGSKALDDMRKSAEDLGASATALKIFNTQLAISEGHFVGMNNYVNEQSQLINKLTARQEIYGREVAEMYENKNIATNMHDYQESLRYIPLALSDAAYTTKIYDTSTQALVDSIRMQREELENLNDVQSRYNLETNENTVKMMQIRLNADSRRGRMTRGEKAQLKGLQRANDELRISTMKNQIDTANLREQLRPEEKQLERVRTSYDEQMHKIQDTYQQDQEAMQIAIDYKELLMSEYTGYMVTANENILETTAKMYDDWLLLDGEFQRKLLEQNPFLAQQGYTARRSIDAEPMPWTKSQYYEKFGDIFDINKNKRSWLDKLIFGGWMDMPLSYASGTNYVPRTGMYELHQGEAVVPANQNKGGSVRFDPITFNINTHADASQVTLWIQQAISAGLIGGGVTTVYG